MKKIVLTIGLPGSGKTTLSALLRTLVGGARINADHVRDTISTDLKFTRDDRRIQAYRMGALCKLALETPPGLSTYDPAVLARLNQVVIADFVCPTQETFREFKWGLGYMEREVQLFTVWMNTISREDSRFADTRAMYERPDASTIDLVVTDYKNTEQMHSIALEIINRLNLSPLHLKKED